MTKVGGEGLSENRFNPELEKEMKQLGWDPTNPDDVILYLKIRSPNFNPNCSEKPRIILPISFQHSPLSDQERINHDRKFHSLEIPQYGQRKQIRPTRPRPVTTTANLPAIPKPPKDRPPF